MGQQGRGVQQQALHKALRTAQRKQQGPRPRGGALLRRPPAGAPVQRHRGARVCALKRRDQQEAAHAGRRRAAAATAGRVGGVGCGGRLLEQRNRCISVHRFGRAAAGGAGKQGGRLGGPPRQRHRTRHTATPAAPAARLRQCMSAARQEATAKQPSHSLRGRGREQRSRLEQRWAHRNGHSSSGD